MTSRELDEALEKTMCYPGGGEKVHHGDCKCFFHSDRLKVQMVAALEDDAILNIVMDAYNAGRYESDAAAVETFRERIAIHLAAPRGETET